MVTQTDENSFSHYIQTVEEVQHRTEQLLQAGEVRSSEQSQFFLDALEELRIALEELHVAEEELRQQNEELAAARQVLEAERQRYRELFEFAPDGYIVSDLNGTVREANRAAAMLLKIEQRHLIGKPLVNFVPESNRRAFRSMLNQLHLVNRLQEWEVKLTCRNGLPFDAALTVETVRDSQGKAVALRWLLRDISGRKQAEEQMRQMQMQNLQLIEADRLKRQFMSVVSHELRTPLNAILGFTHLLLRRSQCHQEARQADLLERILRNGAHLLTMVEEMLDFSRLQAHRLELNLETFDLVELTDSVLEELRSLAMQKSLDLQAVLPESGLLVVNDRTRVRQVIVNLISNAIKFTAIGSVTIEIRELPEDRIKIMVRDTGIGIARVDQERIFQEFWQVNQTATRAHSGTGLGLSITRSLVQLMQGSIAVESQPGQGSTFWVEIPRRVAVSQDTV